MITNEQKRVIIDNMIKLLELPDSAYDKARKRYEDLGEWFDREESVVSGNNHKSFHRVLSVSAQLFDLLTRARSTISILPANFVTASVRTAILKRH